MNTIETGGSHSNQEIFELNWELLSKTARIMDSIFSTPLAALGTCYMLIRELELKSSAVMKLLRELMSSPTQNVER